MYIAHDIIIKVERNENIPCNNVDKDDDNVIIDCERKEEKEEDVFLFKEEFCFAVVGVYII
jgi:hypothetical protein